MAKRLRLCRPTPQSAQRRSISPRGCVLVVMALVVLLPSVSVCVDESSFDFTATEKDFSLYFPAYLANGFFTTTTSLRGTEATDAFMVGVMDYTSGDVSRPAAIPSWAEIDYFDGKSWLNASPVTPSAFKNYRQTLRMYDGVLATQYDWVNGDRTSRIAVTTFVSEDSVHIAATSFSLTPDFSGSIRLLFTLRPHPAPAHRMALARLRASELEAAIAAAGPDPRLTDPTASDRARVWYPGEVQIGGFGGDEAQNRLWVLGRAVGGVEIAEAAVVDLPPGLNAIERKLRPSAQLVELEVTARVEKGKTYVFNKYVAASREGWGGLKPDVTRWAEAARREGFAPLLDKHEAQWHRLWESDIVVEGDPEVQRTIHSDLFNLLENSTEGTAWGMGGCGISPCYLYHVFWDNDSWDFPVVVLLHPSRAKSLEMFRGRTLPPAEARATQHGLKGAMYPWESDPEKGIDETPFPYHAFAEREIHLNADIAIAQWQYYLATSDLDWLRQHGFRVIREAADFWVSRSTYNRTKNRYEILHVTSPDEAYNDVPNDAFTNAVARKALRIATAAARALGLAPDPQWAKVAENMYIPFSDKEQRHLDFDESVPHNKKTWMGSSISWLSYPPLDLYMTRQVRQNDFNFAVKALSELTPDANDMVPVMLGIEAAELGDAQESYKWLKFSMGGFLKPPFNVRSETARNNAVYNLSISAGYLENFLYGFTGLRFTDEGLTSAYPPVLPSEFKSVTLKNISLHQERFDFILSRDSAGKVLLSKRPSVPSDAPMVQATGR